MARRVRLTRRHAAVDDTPYSGMIGNMDRVDPEYGQYSIDDYEVPGWELQEEGDPSAHDERLENHVPAFGARSAKRASSTERRIRKAASDAVKLAVLLLGDKVDQRVIEDQAEDFMRLGNRILNKSLKRYAETEDDYSEGSEQEAIEQMQEDVDISEMELGQEDAMGVETAEESEEAELDIEITDSGSDDVEVSEEDKEALAGIYASEEEEAEEEEEEEEEEEVEVKEKEEKRRRAGIRRLGGQPRTASSKKNVSLSNLWSSAPDVSDIFA